MDIEKENGIQKNKKKFSVIIPTYNHLSDCLIPCIKSIKKYTDLKEVEIIVVANGCTDGTRLYMETIVRLDCDDAFKFLNFNEPLGYARATNEGIKIARGEYIIFLNNDTILLPQSINEWIDILYAPFVLDEKMGVTGPICGFSDPADTYFIIFFCAMTKRDVINRIGLVCEDYNPGGGEDTEFCVEAVKAGFKLAQVPDYKTDVDIRDKLIVGSFPIYHAGEATMNDNPEWNEIFLRNSLMLAKKCGNTKYIEKLENEKKIIRLNLGSANIHIPGYLSVDLNDDRAHVRMDATKLEYEPNSVDEILASHLFEHINPYKSVDVLNHWKNILKPGGKLIMEMPDIEQLCAWFVVANREERYTILNCMYGPMNTEGKDDPTHITSPHLFGWYPQIIVEHLQYCGYVDIKILSERIPHPGKNFRVEAIKSKVVSL